MTDVVVPVVFPDYRISVTIPQQEFDLLPYFEFDNFSIRKYREKFSNLGHSGVLFINGKKGTTKYYEYGRYDREGLGVVQKIRNLPDVKIKNGKIHLASLKGMLDKISKVSKVSGQSGTVKGVYIEVKDKYQKMLDFAKGRMLQNINKNRRKYDILSNSCIHFVKDLVKQAGVDAPWMIDPRPNSYIGEFRDEYIDLNYSFKTKKLVIEDKGAF